MPRTDKNNDSATADVFATIQRINQLSPEGQKSLTAIFETINAASIDGLSGEVAANADEEFVLRVNDALLRLSLLNTGVKIECEDQGALWRKLEKSPDKASQKLLTMEMTLRDHSTIHRFDPWPFPIGGAWLEAGFTQANAASALNTVIGTFITLHGQDLDLTKVVKPAAQP